MSAPAETGPAAAAPRGPWRAVRVLAIAALPLCVTSPGGTVAMVLLALAGLVALSRGAQLTAAARAVFRHAAALYCLLLAVDLANGAVFDSLILSTGVNYLPLIAIVPVHVALVAAGVRQADLRLGVRLAIAAAALLTVPSLISLAGSGPFVPTRGVFLNQIPFGLVVALMGTVCLSHAMIGRGTEARIDALAAGLAAVTVLMTQSKLDWACLLVAYTLAFGLALRRLDPRHAVLSAGLALAAVAGAALLGPVQSEIALLGQAVEQVLAGDASDNTLGQRVLLNHGAWLAFQEKPVLGWGLHGQLDVVKQIIARTSSLPVWAPHLHNDYFVHLVAFGMFGAVFLAGFFALAARVAWHAGATPMRRALFAAIPAIALYMVFDIFFNMDALTGFIALWLAMALQRTRRETSRQAKIQHNMS